MPRVRWPKRGSKSYSPRKRARSIVGRINHWPEVGGDPQLLGFAGYKAGMSHIFVIEDRERVPEYGKEVRNPVTVIDTPPMLVCAVRAYEKTGDGLKVFTEAWTDKPPEDLRRRVKPLTATTPEKGIDQIAAELGKVAELRVLAATQPRLSSAEKKRPELVEIKVGGGTREEQLNYSKELLGKTVKASDIFKSGETLDVIGVTKGKGFQGPVKRWGVRILQNKGRKTKRGVATLGPWHPARIMPGVPRAGQMGFHNRTEYNRRILLIGQDGERVTPVEGYPGYGVVKGDFIALKGGVMGPPKRLVKLRKAVRKSRYPDAAPNVTYLHPEYLRRKEGR